MADTAWTSRRVIDLQCAVLSEVQTLCLSLDDASNLSFLVILDIHNGVFRMGTSRNRELAPIFESVRRGYAVASLNWRLSRGSLFPAPVADCRVAVRVL
jgi:acetyl esterase/lipase